jgi:tRNA pseudouridine38-40 synthase
MSDSEEYVRVRLDLSYDGTDFAGWAVQPRMRTVQGVLEDAVARVTRADPPPRITVAGRTDAGVHARGQVAHVDLPAALWRRLPGRRGGDEGETLARRLRRFLPDDVVVRSASRAPDGFDARFSALERRYSYRVVEAAVAPDPLRRRYAFAYPRALDLDRLNEASRSVAGLRDFSAFCRPREGATTIRELREFSWSRVRDGADAELLVATVRADAFCHSMVRSLVGAVLAVGDARRDLAWLRDVAASVRRSSLIVVAPPHGLTLEDVVYPSDSELASRAERTRRRRSLD